MVLLSASVCGMRKLVAICEDYGRSHGLVYNVQKSQVMVFEVGSKRLDRLPAISGLIPPLLPTHCVSCVARINSGIPPIDNEQ
jgi:hypothetical protein